MGPERGWWGALAEVVVVGAGVGGLAAAIRLAVAGHDVTVLERLDRAGGKLAERSAAGFTWETGPSLLTLPDVFDDLARTADRRLDELVTLRRLDPICRYRFPDGSTFDHRAELDDAVAAAEALSPGSGAGWRAFVDHARQVWEVAERSFFVGPMASPLERQEDERAQHPEQGVDRQHRRPFHRGITTLVCGFLPDHLCAARRAARRAASSTADTSRALAPLSLRSASATSRSASATNSS